MKQHPPLDDMLERIKNDVPDDELRDLDYQLGREPTGADVMRDRWPDEDPDDLAVVTARYDRLLRTRDGFRAYCEDRGYHEGARIHRVALRSLGGRPRRGAG